MSTTSKSPRKVAVVAWALAKDAMPDYSHRCSLKKLTQPQLFVCLVLKAFFKTDYRGIAAILTDAGYDSEASHVFARTRPGCRTIIPPRIGRRTNKPPAGYWRRRMSRWLDEKAYGQRWRGETVNSMLKRRLGEALGATNYWSQFREMFLRAIVNNVIILWRYLRGSLRSTRDPVSCPVEN